ncbi:hypothetical protein [Aureimonas pseudogalii]|uniref:Uncharacterized protein n=1 Tax=Aureimonas pseudogalii TaxID=1744844 RepID=A0A7W6EB66_9HYPH|nr:hypothetical protein [Aureimonas pseudogalii]MBB3996851.1 hypothetical protein [Aureimonas pseudogalii]
MTGISPPKTTEDYANRSADCQAAMDAAFLALRTAGEEAGWTEDDVAIALLELARGNIKGMMEDRKMLGTIEVARWTGTLGPEGTPFRRPPPRR